MRGNKSEIIGRHRGFTLIELMVVVLIVGLVYGLAIQGIERTSDVSKELSLKTLVEFMQAKQHGNDLSLICTDRCKSCTLFADGAAVADIPPFLERRASFYRFNYYTGSEPLEWPPLYDEEGREQEVCFRYDLYRDGSRSEMLAEYDGEVVDLPGPFETTALYATLNDAIEAKQARIEEIRQ